MTGDDDLTDEQRTFATFDDGCFVTACPGAGKTKTIIERLKFLTEKLPRRQGIAVLSYTNAAVDEFAERCRRLGLQPLLEPPHFHGTLDAFIRAFIFMPIGIDGVAQRPRVVERWADIGIGPIRFQGYAGGLLLDAVDWQMKTINTKGIYDANLRNHIESTEAQCLNRANARRLGLQRKGIVCMRGMRELAETYIADACRGPALLAMINGRFKEIIIDEGQDCNPADLRIAGWLRDNGVRVTIVCDPDQAIYGFRSGSTASIRGERDRYPPEARLTLTGNFRSTANICSFTATLKHDQMADEAKACHRDHPTQVILLKYGSRITKAIGEGFLTEVRREAIIESQAIVLAHGFSKARQATGGFAEPDIPPDSVIGTIALEIGRFWQDATSKRNRAIALQRIEKKLLDHYGLRNDEEPVPDCLERLGLEARNLRRRTLEFVMKLPQNCEKADQKAWMARAQEAVKTFPLDIPGIKPSKPRAITKDGWSAPLRQRPEDCIKYSTIHEAKGCEYDAVCVVIPPDTGDRQRTADLITSWEHGTDEEAKRVIYVGATRARKLLMLAVPESYYDRCCTLLSGKGVAFTRQDLTVKPPKSKKIKVPA